MNQKFNIGDKVKCIKPFHNDEKYGEIFTISEMCTSGNGCRVTKDNSYYHRATDRFVLASNIINNPKIITRRIGYIPAQGGNIQMCKTLKECFEENGAKFPFKVFFKDDFTQDDIPCEVVGTAAKEGYYTVNSGYVDENNNNIGFSFDVRNDEPLYQLVKSPVKEDIKKCVCDFHTVILVTGCKCGYVKPYGT